VPTQDPLAAGLAVPIPIARRAASPATPAGNHLILTP
jgi:hypothetical protein